MGIHSMQSIHGTLQPEARRVESAGNVVVTAEPNIGPMVDMPWTKKVQHTAEAIAHGWKPRGSVKGFSKAFADYVIAETPSVGTRKPVKKGKK